MSMIDFSRFNKREKDKKKKNEYEKLNVFFKKTFCSCIFIRFSIN